MTCNLFDLLVLAYCAYGLWRGYRQGLAAELPGTVSIVAALVAGGGLFHWSERLVEKTALLAGETSGFGTFLGILIATVVLWKYFKARLRDWAAHRWPDPRLQKRGGLIAGGLETAGLCALIVLLASTLPVGLLRKPFTDGSAFGRATIKVLRPAYLFTKSA